MISAAAFITLATALAAPAVEAAIAQTFAPAAACPECTSSVYVGANNGTITNSPLVPGIAFDRFIQIWLENTDFAVAAADPNFQNIGKQGIVLSSLNGVTHPSEPNYVASITGSFWGMGDDSNYYFPSNVSTMVDLLEAKNISWATYQENMPYTAFQGDYPQTNYFNASAGSYTYYKRKHNPFIICNSIANVTSRAKRIRNFNDFAVDLNASALPQWVYITPNLVNDGHDTTTTFLGDWVNWWLNPLLQNKNFNDNRTLILLTFDENANYAAQNTVYSVLLGGAVPANLTGTTDPTYYTHYSSMSTVQYNWKLGNLGRDDTNMTVNNVYSAFTSALNVTTNNNITLTNNATMPLTNLTTVFPGVANSAMWIPIPAPGVANGLGGGNTFVPSNTNTALTLQSLPQPLNLTNGVNPIEINPNISLVISLNGTSTNSSATGSGAAASASASKASGAEKTMTLPVVALAALVFGVTML